MSYRRAWLLIDDMNRCFRDTVVAAQPGGSHGGGAKLTAFGEKLISDYRAIESSASLAAKNHLRGLESSLRSGSEVPRKTSIKGRVR